MALSAACAQLRLHPPTPHFHHQQAHLRARLYAELKGGRRPGASPSNHSPSLQQHVLNCLVAEHLAASGHKYALSVFMAESGSGGLPRLSRADLLRLLGVLPGSQVHALLTHGGGCSSPPAAEGSGPDATATPSLAEAVVAALGRLGGHISTAAAACQTGDGTPGPGSTATTSSGAPSSQELAARLAAIEDEYRRRSTQQEAASAAALEERMAEFQRQCEARCAAQLAERLASLRDGELAAVRAEERERHRAELEAERAALAAAHQERLAALHRQEEELLDRARRQHRELDGLREEHLRRMRAEEERLQAWKADSEARAAAAAAAARQQLQAAEAAAAHARVDAEAGERRLAAALEQAQQREAAAVRAQAAADAEVCRVSQLQAQLAAALEEQGALRQQLAAARAGHQAEQAEMQQEVAALRREQARLQQAPAAAPAACLSPEEAVRLQAAVRRLVAKADELHAELEASRRREQLWKSSTAEAEKLLGKVGAASKVTAKCARGGHRSASAPAHCASPGHCMQDLCTPSAASPTPERRPPRGRTVRCNTARTCALPWRRQSGRWQTCSRKRQWRRQGWRAPLQQPCRRPAGRSSAGVRPPRHTWWQRSRRRLS